jgi:hypothetical protein
MHKYLAMPLLLVLALSLAELRAQPAGAPGRVPPPTTQQLQSMIDAKQYPEVLQQSQRILALKGAAAKDVDKYDVYMLRAEAQLQLKQQGPAAQSYTLAAKATTDPTKAGVPKAMVTLLQKSRGFMYTPKPTNDPTKTIAPLNILDEKERKTALASLFEDEWKPTQVKIDALKKQGNTSLTPIIEAASLAGEMRGLEMAATGTDTQTSSALSDLTDSAAKLMTDYLDRESKKVDDIDRAANLPQSNNANETNRMGLTASQATDLKDIIATCGKLFAASDLVAASAGAKSSDFKSIGMRSSDLGKKADEVLNADYSAMLDNGVNRPPVRGGGSGNPIPRNIYTPVPSHNAK